MKLLASITLSATVLRSAFVRQRELTFELARCEIQERYAGSMLGALWAILTPVATMGILVGLFAFVFPVRFGSESSLWSGAALILSGLVPWIAVVDVSTRAPSVFHAQRALVRQVVFPIEVLPARTVLTAVVPWTIGTCVLFAVALPASGFKATMLLLPILWTLQFLGMLGICFLLASLGAWIRDLREFIGILTNIGLYAAPILFLPATMDAFPRAVRYAFYANPFSHMVWCYQDAIAFGRFEHPASWIVFPICALGVALIGTVLFDRVRHSLPEVL